MKLKKLLTLGSITAAVAPIVAIVSCSGYTFKIPVQESVDEKDKIHESTSIQLNENQQLLMSKFSTFLRGETYTWSLYNVHDGVSIFKGDCSEGNTSMGKDVTYWAFAMFRGDDYSLSPEAIRDHYDFDPTSKKGIEVVKSVLIKKWENNNS